MFPQSQGGSPEQPHLSSRNPLGSLVENASFPLDAVTCLRKKCLGGDVFTNPQCRRAHCKGWSVKGEASMVFAERPEGDLREAAVPDSQGGWGRSQLTERRARRPPR